MSPELFDPEQFGLKDNRRTKESDCYALAMVILEVLTGQAPFPRYDAFVVVRKVVNGKRPERPEGPEAAWFADDLWEMLERCWLPDPKLRPAVEAVIECLEWSSTAWRPLPPSADDDFQMDGDRDSFSTMSHLSRTSRHLYLNLRLPIKLSANQTISQDADQPVVLSQSPAHDVDAGLGSSRLSPASRQQPADQQDGALLQENEREAVADIRRPLKVRETTFLSMFTEILTSNPGPMVTNELWDSSRVLKPRSLSDGLDPRQHIPAEVTNWVGPIDCGALESILRLASSQNTHSRHIVSATLRNLAVNSRYCSVQM